MCFESDAKLVIQIWTVCDLPLLHWSTRDFIEDIKKKCLSFASCSFVWSPRASNCLAHLICKWGCFSFASGCVDSWCSTKEWEFLQYNC